MLSCITMFTKYCKVTMLGMALRPHHTYYGENKDIWNLKKSVFVICITIRLLRRSWNFLCMQKYVLLKLVNNSEASRVAFLQTHQPIFYQIRKSDMTLNS